MNLIQAQEIFLGISWYFWIMFSLGVTGVINNCVVIFIFYRLKWFKERKTILFLNLAVIDMLECIVVVTIFADYIFNINKGIAKFKTQQSCVEILCFFYGPATMSVASDFGIAIDRLMSKWCPYRWCKYEIKFRTVIIIISWIKGVTYIVVYPMTAASDICKTLCLSAVDLPHNGYKTTDSVINDSTAGIVVTIYAIIPSLTALY